MTAEPQAVLHENLPLLEVADQHLLDELYADARAARCLLRPPFWHSGRGGARQIQ